MNAGTVDETWGRAIAVEMIERTVKWAAAEASKGKWHTNLVRDIGQIATVGNMPEIRESALRLLVRAPDKAFVAGIITNISDLSGLVRRELPEVEAISSWPKYERAKILEYARRLGNVERLTLDGRFKEAEAAATDDFAIECYVATRALMGDFEAAIALMDAPSFPPTRTHGPFMVVCIESHRAGNRALSEAMLRRRVSAEAPYPWPSIHLAAGYLGLVPWGGYPYSDY